MKRALLAGLAAGSLVVAVWALWLRRAGARHSAVDPIVSPDEADLATSGPSANAAAAAIAGAVRHEDGDSAGGHNPDATETGLAGSAALGAIAVTDDTVLLAAFEDLAIEEMVLLQEEEWLETIATSDEPQATDTSAAGGGHAELMEEGNLLFAAGEVAPAVAAYGAAIVADPGAAAGYYNRANALARLGALDEARADLDRALEIDPGFADAWNNRGMLRLALGDNEGALADLAAATRARPGDAEFMVNRGAALLELGRGVEALEVFDEAISRGAGAPARFGAARAAAMAGQSTVALARATEAIFADPSYRARIDADPLLGPLRAAAEAGS
jgi:tetratricopeptide (TPR) repeat protein